MANKSRYSHAFIEKLHSLHIKGATHASLDKRFHLPKGTISFQFTMHGFTPNKRHWGKYHSPEMHKRMVDLYHNGLSTYQAAKEIGCSPATIQQVLVLEKVKFRTMSESVRIRMGLSVGDVDKMVELCLQGYTATEISQILKRERNTVIKYLHGRGISIIARTPPKYGQELCTPEYRAWRAILSRTDPHSSIARYRKYYSGRGITVCDRWRESYWHFLSDMGRRPNGNLSIDRINNDGNYEPGNCRWATAKEQNNNQRKRRVV